MPRNNGFTLIELSIVLVIIGLLAGGILAGRDLIEAATIRQQVSQIEKIDTAVMTFRGKYGGIPGDLRADAASSVGFAARSGGSGHGNGNGRVETCDLDPLYSAAELGCEVILFWSDLSAANLIDGTFTTATDANPVFSTYQESLALYPVTKVSNTVTLIPALERLTSKNWLAMAHISSRTAGGVTTNTGLLISVATALAIDMKMDDQDPIGGRVQVREQRVTTPPEGFFSATPNQGPISCIETRAYNYDFTPDYPPCQINFRMSY